MAIAPLLIIWLGSGLASKVIVTALITFFPALIATIVGIRSVDPDLHDLLRSLRASRWQLFWKLELPAALPMIFGGLKLSVTLAVVGAVVGEFVGANAGLGYLINLGRGILDTPLMFVAILRWSSLPRRSTLRSSRWKHGYCAGKGCKKMQGARGEGRGSILLGLGTGLNLDCKIFTKGTFA